MTGQEEATHAGEAQSRDRDKDGGLPKPARQLQQPVADTVRGSGGPGAEVRHRSWPPTAPVWHGSRPPVALVRPDSHGGPWGASSHGGRQGTFSHVLGL